MLICLCHRQQKNQEAERLVSELLENDKGCGIQLRACISILIIFVTLPHLISCFQIDCAFLHCLFIYSDVVHWCTHRVA